MVAYTPANTRRPTRVYVPVIHWHKIGTAMAVWIKANQVGFMFLTTLILGLILIAMAAFTISLTLGLLTAGTSMIGGGHWVAYLKTSGVRT